VNQIIRVVGEYFFLISLIVVAWYFLWARRRTQWSLLWQILAGGVVAVLLADLAGHLYYDPRPFVSGHLAPLIAHAADNGFPSDHALLCSFLGFTMLLYSRRAGVFLLAVAVLVGWARVAARIHHPQDVVASFALAALSVAIAHLVARLWSRRSHALT